MILTVSTAPTHRVTISAIAHYYRQPPGRVRKWLHDGSVHRLPDGSINARCLAVFIERNTPGATYVDDHATVCNTRL